MNTAIDTIDDTIDYSILDGELNPIMNYYITLGQSNSSKGVMFVLYAIPVKLNKHSLPIYLGQLADDLQNAIINARKKIKKFKIEIDRENTISDRRIPSTMPFGKYKNMTIESIFDIDPKYIFWLNTSNSVFHIKSKTLLDTIKNYELVAKQFVIDENRSKSTSAAMPIEDKCSNKSLEVYNKISTGSFHGNIIFKYYMKDSEGNKFIYEGSKILPDKGAVDLKCRIVGNYEALGIIYNKIKLK